MKPIRQELIKTEKNATEALLVRLIRFPEERAVVAAIIQPDELATELKEHKKLYSLILAAPGGELEPMALQLYEILLARNDGAASDLLADLADIPHELSCLSETIRLCLYLHDQSNWRENLELEDGARMEWVSQECGRVQIPVETEDEQEW